MDEARDVCKMIFIHLADVVVVAEDEYEIRAVVRPIVVLFLVRVKENCHDSYFSYSRLHYITLLSFSFIFITLL